MTRAETVRLALRNYSHAEDAHATAEKRMWESLHTLRAACDLSENATHGQMLATAADILASEVSA